MKQIFNIVEGTLIGFLVSGWLVIMGDAISGTTVGIVITMILCTIFGAVVHRLTGACGGLMVGGCAVMLGNMVSQSTFGVVITLLGGTLIGGLIAWEISSIKRANMARSGQYAR